MPVPKRKRSRARRDKRFANKGIKAKAFGSCSNCSEVIAPHAVCKNCGHYRGRKIMTTKTERATKRGEALKAKADQQKAAQQAAPVDTEPQEA